MDSLSEYKPSFHGSSDTASLSSKDSSNSSYCTENEDIDRTDSPNRKFSVDIHYDDGTTRMSSHEPITSNHQNLRGSAFSEFAMDGTTVVRLTCNQDYNKWGKTDPMGKVDTVQSSMTDNVVPSFGRENSMEVVSVAARIEQFSGKSLAQAAAPFSSSQATSSHQEVFHSNDHGLLTQGCSIPQEPLSTSTGLRRIRSLVTSRTTTSRSGSLHSVQEEEASEYSEDLNDEEVTLQTAVLGNRDLVSTDEESSHWEDSMTDLESVHTENPQFIAIGIVKATPGEESLEQAQSSSKLTLKNSINFNEKISEAVAEEIARKEHDLKQQASFLNTDVDAIRRRSAPAVLAARRLTSQDEELSSISRGSTRSSFSGIERNTLISDTTATKVLSTAIKPPSHKGTSDLLSGNGSAIAYPTSTPTKGACTHPRVQGSSGMSETDREVKIRAMQGSSGRESTSRRSRAITQRSRSRSSESTSQPLVPMRNMSTVSSLHGSSQNVSSVASIECEGKGDEHTEVKANEDEVSVCPSLQTIQSTSSGITLDEKTTERIARSAPLRARRPIRTFSGDEGVISAPSAASISSTSSGSEEERKMSATNSAAVASKLPNLSHLQDDKGSMRTTRSSQSSSSSTKRCTRPSDEKAAYRRHATNSTAALIARAPVRTPSISDRSLALRDYPETVEDLPLQSDTSNTIAGNNTEDLEAQAGVPVLLPGAFAVGGIEDEEYGYDSGYDDTDRVIFGGPEVEDIHEETAPVGNQRESVSGSVDASPPLQAELYEESFINAEILIEEEETGEKVLRRSYFLQMFCAIFAILTVVGIVIGVVLPRAAKRGSLESPSDHNKVKEVKGWNQIGELLVGPTYKDNIRFGNSVAVSGDGTRMVVGLPGANGNVRENLNSAGSVFIYDLINGTSWEKIFQIDGIFANAESGTRVALSENGSRVAVGAPAFASSRSGYVAIYQESGVTGDWNMVGDLITGDDTIAEVFGDSIAFSADGSIVAIGDKYSDRKADGVEDTGLLRVFRELNNTWVQMGEDVYGSEPSERFGWALSLSGDGTRVAASSLGTSDIPGSVQVFDFVGDSWKGIGSMLIGQSTREVYGASIAMSSDGLRLATGATSYSRGGEEAGVGVVRSYLFDETQQDWLPLGKPLEGANQFDAYGSSISMSSTGDVLAIGGPENHDFCRSCGHIQVFRYLDEDWKRMGTALGKNESDGGQFGFALALSPNGTRIVGAAPFTTFDGFVSKVGQVLAFDVDG
ncbi:CHU large protein [Nitzschia inconspicua]|uniref:CHU large protein n=1 Tax=Nitzschia inconspicua TaxID=303405 RepID=A0A9K3LR67_9STRA|nr:CHU large protein [Nitzschia inconspicua]